MIKGSHLSFSEFMGVCHILILQGSQIQPVSDWRQLTVSNEASEGKKFGVLVFIYQRICTLSRPGRVDLCIFVVLSIVIAGLSQSSAHSLVT